MSDRAPFQPLAKLFLFALLAIWGIPSLHAATTNPATKDTDGDGFWDGPDVLQEAAGQQYWRLGEDKNGNGKYEPKGADGILGTTDDEFDPNDQNSHPVGKNTINYEDAASWHDANLNGIPDKREDTNHNGAFDPDIDESDFRQQTSSTYQCNVYYYDARAQDINLGTGIVLNHNSASFLALANHEVPTCLSHILCSYWKITSLYPGPEFGSAQVTLYYNPAELEAAAVSDPTLLVVMHSTDGRKWTRMATDFENDLEAHALTFEAVEFGYFIIGQESIPEKPAGKDSLFINANGSEDFRTIQEGLDHIWLGGTIVVRNGYYKENITFPRWISAKQGNAGLTSFIRLFSEDFQEPLTSAWQAKRCYIDGESAGPVILLYGGENAQTRVQGFQLVHGLSRFGNGGGGILGNGSSATISYCNISYNSGYFGGGGISQINGSIDHCVANRNTSLYRYGRIPEGAGIFLCNGNFQYNTVIDNLIIAYDETTGGFCKNTSGSGIARSNPGSFDHCIIWGNSSSDEMAAEIDARSTRPKHSCLQNGQIGETNTNQNPNFVSKHIADFRILPMHLPFGTVGAEPEMEPSQLQDIDPYIHTREYKNASGIRCYELKWEEYPDDAAVLCYNVYRSSDNDIFTLISSKKEKRFTDTNYPPNQYYVYIVTITPKESRG